MREVILECENVGHWYGSKRVLNNVNLRILRGQFVALVGPSGCGKSTLLHAILGTHPPRAGRVLMSGQSYTHPHRDRGIVYQRYSLFPFLTAEGNVALGPMLDQTTLWQRCLQPWKWRAVRKQHVQEAVQLLQDVGLGAAVHLYPDEMSGGMRQRVALAQALIMRPKLLLLDEPFGALDEATREDLQLMLLRLYQENMKALEAGHDPPYTVLMVTHELNEALYVADRMVGLSQYHSDGSSGATIVYDRPAPVFSPLQPRDIAAFSAQKDEVLEVVFDESSKRHHSEYVTFWRDFPSQVAQSPLATPAG